MCHPASIEYYPYKYIIKNCIHPASLPYSLYYNKYILYKNKYLMLKYNVIK